MDLSTRLVLRPTELLMNVRGVQAENGTHRRARTQPRAVQVERPREKTRRSTLARPGRRRSPYRRLVWFL